MLYASVLFESVIYTYIYIYIYCITDPADGPTVRGAPPAGAPAFARGLSLRAAAGGPGPAISFDRIHHKFGICFLCSDLQTSKPTPKSRNLDPGPMPKQ